MTADVELLRAENKRLANALQSLLRYVERCREAGVLVCDDIGPEEFARYELEQALSLPPEQPAAAQQGQAVELAPPSAPVGVDYAKRLATSLWQRHYREDAPQWEPFDDLPGLLSQIDNMVSGLTRAPALAQQPTAVDRARFRKAPCYLCGYNGAGYFQPETHPCAALYHATKHQEPKP